jgi:hypothetical protein
MLKALNYKQYIFSCFVDLFDIIFGGSCVYKSEVAHIFAVILDYHTRRFLAPVF